MDPNVAFLLLLEAIEANDHEAAAGACDDLAGWFAKGGFMPTVPTTEASLFAVTATYERKLPDGWTTSGQIPTFYLNPAVQGITSEDHARRIALDLLHCGTKDTDGITYHVSAVAI